MNYDSSQVGVPYVRAHRLTIFYPDQGKPPVVVIDQSLACKMADSTVRQLEEMPQLTVELDMVADAMKAIPLVDRDTGEPLGAQTNLATVYMHLLAVVRNIQISKE